MFARFIGICAFLILIPGCLLQNLSSSERLRDAVVGYNDECRWGRTDLAVQRVWPEYRSTFRQSHFAWGRSIQIADQEIMNVDVNSDEEEAESHAVSYVTIRWYDTNGMILSDSVLRQVWRKVRGNYILLREEVADGDQGLLRQISQDTQVSELDQGS